MWSNVRIFLSKLIRDGHYWQRTDINGAETKNRLGLSGLQWLLLGCAVLSSTFLLTKGFSSEFIGYIISSLSIFIGLFFTLIVLFFERFDPAKYKEKGLSNKQKKQLIKKKNYFKQIVALTSYSILISILCIGLLSVHLSWKFLSLDVSRYYLIVNFKEWNTDSVMRFWKSFFLLCYRSSVTYFLLDFILILVYTISSLYSLISKEFDSVWMNNR